MTDAAPAPPTSPVGIPAIGITAASTPAPTPRPTTPTSRTLLVDAAPQRLRRTEDLLDIIVSVAAALSMLILAAYGHATTTGVTQDVQNALASLLHQVLIFPLQAIEGLATFIIPLAVLLERVLRRTWRAAGQAALGAAGAWVLGIIVYHLLLTWGPAAVLAGLTTSGSGTAQLGISTTFATLAGLLTGAGERRSTPVTRYSWAALWVIVGLTVLRSALTLPGAMLSVLLGRTIGLAVRYAFGVEDHSVHGIALIRALRRAGVDATRVVRMDSAPGVRAWTVTTDAPLGYTEHVRENPLAAAIDMTADGDPPENPTPNHTPGTAGADSYDTRDTAPNPKTAPRAATSTDGPADAAASTPSSDEATPATPAADTTGDPHSTSPAAASDINTPHPSQEQASADTSSITPAIHVDLGELIAQAHSSALTEGRPAVHRMYAVWDTAGVRRDVTVLDADRQIAGFIATVWDRIRVKGLSPSRDMSVRPAAEHAALMTLEASRAGVNTPALYGMAEAQESMLLVTDHVIGARSFDELTDELGHNIPDHILTQLWQQLSRAHAAGLAHRELTGSSVVIDADSRLWLLGWDAGETISRELSRRVDLAQALALVASAVGVERAIDTASRSLTTAQLASIAPMLQRVVLPAATREALGRRGTLLQELRDALVDFTPTAHAEPAKLTRFSWRTVVMATVGLVALWTLLARMNIEQITQAVASANVWWIVGALVFSLATYVGAGLSLVAFSPVRLSVWRSTEVHLASSVVSLVAPAGVGGAAINLRFLARQGLPTAIGVATVALVQVMQFLVTVVLLLVLAATTGQSTGLTLPSGWVVLIATILVGVVAVLLAIPSVRAWVWKKVEPTYRQVWPRLVWIISNPARLAIGIGGTVLLSLSYILAFGASLWAFGYTLPFSVLAITYLASNTVGSVVPSPGGIGPVEIALTAGLVTAGIPSGVALSAAIVYRLVTFWMPIPVGWLSLQRLQKKGAL